MSGELSCTCSICVRKQHQHWYVREHAWIGSGKLPVLASTCWPTHVPYLRSMWHHLHPICMTHGERMCSILALTSAWNVAVNEKRTHHQPIMSPAAQGEAMPRVDTFASNLHDAWGAHAQHHSPPASETNYEPPPRLSTESIRSTASAASKASSGESTWCSPSRLFVTVCMPATSIMCGDKHAMCITAHQLKQLWASSNAFHRVHILNCQCSFQGVKRWVNISAEWSQAICHRVFVFLLSATFAHVRLHSHKYSTRAICWCDWPVCHSDCMTQCWGTCTAVCRMCVHSAGESLQLTTSWQGSGQWHHSYGYCMW